MIVVNIIFNRLSFANLKFHNPDMGLSYIYNNLAEIFYFKKEYDKAIEFYSLSSAVFLMKPEKVNTGKPLH